MKKVLFPSFVTFAAALAFTLVACNCGPQSRTASEAASEYSQHLISGDYGTLADVIVFMDDVTVSPGSDALQAAHHPDIASRGGIKEIVVIAENVAPDGRSAEVSLDAHYNDGSTETINYTMVNHDATWKIAANSEARLWSQAVSDAENEILTREDAVELPDDSGDTSSAETSPAAEPATSPATAPDTTSAPSPQPAN